MRLSSRLEAIVALVPLGSSVADVGSDHASVPLALLKNASVQFAECIENKKGPYGRMKKAVESAGFADRCLTSFSDGLTHADSRVDCAILAGLGGLLIASILRRDLPEHPNIRTIVVDPHSERPSAYKALQELGFREETARSIEEENHYYEISRWVKVESVVPYTETELAFGPLSLREKPQAWRHYYENECARLEQIDSSLDETQADKKKQLRERISLIKEALA
jgi:tRNA (adenine22-N1)-methyltransferase